MEIVQAAEVALITGAGRGIGRAVSLRLAFAGAAVALIARTAAEIEAVAARVEAGGGRALALCADVTDDAALSAAVDRVHRSFGDVSILVNNAGWGPPRAPVEHVRPEDLDRMLATNLRAPILLARLLLPKMKRHGRGFVVNIASAFALSPHAGEAAYAATKAGLLAFSRALALECTGSGVRVAALCPGHVDTALIPPNRRIDRSAFLRPDDVAEVVFAFVRGEIGAGDVEIPVHRARGTA